MKVLITGADGFIGRHLSRISEGGGHIITLMSRTLPESAEANWHAIGDMTNFGGWETLFEGVDVIVHLAARVHQMDNAGTIAYDLDNTQVVKRMTTAAITSGVKRFIFLSTIKVNGEAIKVNGEATTARPFTAFDQPAPLDPYAISKATAEKALLELAESTALEVVIIRPPLVYGPGVKANFQSLWALAGSRLPLPFRLVRNRRDMVSVYNLCDLISHCFDSPAAKNKTLLVSDGRPYSLAELITTMRKVLGRSAGLFPVPVGLLSGLLALMGKRDVAGRLTGDLEVDISDTVNTLDWQPTWSLEQTLQRMLDEQD